MLSSSEEIEITMAPLSSTTKATKAKNSNALAANIDLSSTFLHSLCKIHPQSSST